MKKILMLMTILIITVSAFTQTKSNPFKNNYKKQQEIEKLKNNPFVKDLAIKVKNKVKLKIYKEKLKGNNFAHPQTFTLKQANKILHCLKVSRDIPVLILRNEDILKLQKKFVTLFKSAKKDEWIVIKRENDYINGKTGKVIKKEIDEIGFCFVDNNTLKVVYHPRGYRRGRVFECGNGISYFKGKDGKVYKGIILIDKSVWTTKLNRSPFEKDYEKIFQSIDKIPQQPPVNDNSSKIEQTTPKQTISIEQMEKELQRLKNMLDKKLITEEEYKVLKKNVMKKAGL